MLFIEQTKHSKRVNRTDRILQSVVHALYVHCIVYDATVAIILTDDRDAFMVDIDIRYWSDIHGIVGMYVPVLIIYLNDFVVFSI